MLSATTRPTSGTSSNCSTLASMIASTGRSGARSLAVASPTWAEIPRPYGKRTDIRVLGLFQRREHVACQLVGHALQAGDGVLQAQPVQVGQVRITLPSTSWSTSFSPRPSMSMARRWAIQDRVLALGGAEAPRAAVIGLAFLAHHRHGTDRQWRGMVNMRPVAVPLVRHDGYGHTRITSPAQRHDHRVAHRYVCASPWSSLWSVALVTVAPPTNTGASLATGVSLPVRPTCPPSSASPGPELCATAGAARA